MKHTPNSALTGIDEREKLISLQNLAGAPLPKWFTEEAQEEAADLYAEVNSFQSLSRRSQVFS